MRRTAGGTPERVHGWAQSDEFAEDVRLDKVQLFPNGFIGYNINCRECGRRHRVWHSCYSAGKAQKMTTEPVLSLVDAQATAATAAFPHVTEASIKQKIHEVRYHCDGQLTICIIEMKNGFMVVGKAAPAHPANFSRQIGERYAFEDAFKQLWPLEGYLLCDKLASTPNGR